MFSRIIVIEDVTGKILLKRFYAVLKRILKQPDTLRVILWLIIVFAIDSITIEEWWIPSCKCVIDV